jgi:D-alanyl-D-alanine carboxypeptidase
MNAKVAEAGLSNTNFTSPDGLSSDESQYTTAFDLAHLGAMAMTYDKIEETVSQYRATVTSIGPEARVYELKNTNLLLETADDSEYATDGVIGLKSGSTEQAGACLVLAKRQRGGNLVIGVVLGSELSYDEATGLIATDGRWEDMQAIIGSIDDEFAWLNPESMRDVPGLFDELSAWQVGLEDDSSIVVARDLAESIRYQLELTGLASAGDTAGRVLFFAGSDLIDERPLVAR